MRLGAAVFRRYEVQHSGYPYRLFPLVHDKYSREEKAKVAERLLREERSALDTYSRGVRMCFPSVERLLSAECHAVLVADFASQGYSTDCVERANAELVACTPKRAPGRNFANAAREAVLRQLTIVHRAHGGGHPLGRGVLAAISDMERTQSLPLLQESFLGETSPDLQPLRLMDADAESQAPPMAAVGADIVPGSAQDLVGPFSLQPAWAERPNPAKLEAQRGASNRAPPKEKPPAAKRGLSPSWSATSS